MTESTSEKGTPILIEFSPRPGVEAVAIYRRPVEELKDKSEKALTTAMGTIEEMARRVSALHDKIPVEFSQVEVETLEHTNSTRFRRRICLA